VAVLALMVQRQASQVVQSRAVAVVAVDLLLALQALAVQVVAARQVARLRQVQQTQVVAAAVQ
jgi:hypothetical protein